jgi:hypothetical protein
MTEHAELEVAQQYAAGTLDANAAAAFEDHMVGCERCQNEVRMSVGLRRAMRATRPIQRRRGVIGGIAVLLAATIVGFLVVPSGRDRALAELGQVSDPPAYEPMSVRTLSQRASADSLFASAMSAYAERRYPEAAAGLRRARDAGADTVRSTFYLASADLMSGHPRQAADEFGRVIAAGAAASPYLAEAHLYRARALLRLGRADDALADLAAVEPDDAPLRASADSLASRVRQVLAR